MTQPIGTLLAPTAACEDTLQAGGDKFNIHIGCSTQDDHCFSADTELLTHSGWITYDKIKARRTVAATFNLETGRMEHHLVNSLHIYDSFAELWRFRSKGTEILVTSQHRMVYRGLAKNRPGGHRWQIIPAEQLAGYSRTHAEIPAAGIGHDVPYPRPDDYLRLLAWIVSEGSAMEIASSGHGYKIAQSEGPLADRIEALLNGSATPFHKNVRDHRGRAFGTSKYITTHRSISFYLPSAYCRATFRVDLTDEKTPQDHLLGLASRQFRIFMGELILGDGNVRNHGYSAKNKADAVDEWVTTGRMPCVMTYASKSRRLIDWLQALCARNGIRTLATVRPSGMILLHFADRATIGSLVADRVPYTGNVWCVSVMKNQTLFLRRKGRVFVAGNTQYLKTCAVRRRFIDVVALSTDNPPVASVLGDYPTLAFTTNHADEVRFSLGVPAEMNVEKASSLFAVLAPGTASTEAIRSVLDYLNTCHAAGNPTAAVASTANTVCTTGSNALSTAANRLAEILVGTFTSGLFAQNSVLSFEWRRKSSSTANGDAHAGNIHAVEFVFQYYDRRASTST